MTCALSLAPGSTGAAAAPPRDVQEPADDAPRLVPHKDGTLRHHHANFTAVIHPDGSVEFRDERGGSAPYLAARALIRREPRKLMTLFRPTAPRNEFEEQALDPLRRDIRNLEYEHLKRGVPIVQVKVAQFGGLAEWTLSQRQASKPSRRSGPASSKKCMPWLWTTCPMCISSRSRLAERGGV
jgi:hypothetical protein